MSSASKSINLDPVARRLRALFEIVTLTVVFLCDSNGLVVCRETCRAFLILFSAAITSLGFEVSSEKRGISYENFIVENVLFFGTSFATDNFFRVSKVVFEGLVLV